MTQKKTQIMDIGDILRSGPTRLTYQAIEEQRRMALAGNLLIDVPPHTRHPGGTHYQSQRSKSMETTS